MESKTYELTDNWLQLLTNQKGTILTPTKPTDKWQGDAAAIASVLICVNDTADNDKAIAMPKEAINFSVDSNVWVKAEHGNPFIGVIK